MIFLQTLDLSEQLGSNFALGGIMAAIAAFALIGIVMSLALYVYTSLTLMAIAKKRKFDKAWFAWIPIANFYMITQIAGWNGNWTWLILAVMIPPVAGIAGLALTVIGIMMFWAIAEKLKFPGWTSLLLLIPIANLVILGIWAWSKR